MEGKQFPLDAVYTQEFLSKKSAESKTAHLLSGAGGAGPGGDSPSDFQLLAAAKSFGFKPTDHSGTQAKASGILSYGNIISPSFEDWLENVEASVAPKPHARLGRTKDEIEKDR